MWASRADREQVIEVLKTHTIAVADYRLDILPRPEGGGFQLLTSR